MTEIDENIQKLKDGDEDAFTYLYNEFESALINHLYKMLGRREKAEEIFQEVMMTMIKKINFYESRDDLKNSFKAWLFRIATNQAIDELRRCKKMKIEFNEGFNEGYNEDIAEEVIKIDFNKKLSEAIMSLPLVQRTFLNLKVKEDLSHFEIATICDCHVNTVKQGLFRARRSLKNLLIKEGLAL